MKKSRLNPWTAAAFGLLLLSFFLGSCDPGLNGSLKVFNRTDSVLTVVTFDYGKTDSSIFVIAPQSSQTIKVMGGLGNQATFDCCPCELKSIRMRTTNGDITKDPNDKNNWSIPNKSKQRKYSGEDLRCEFYVASSDI